MASRFHCGPWKKILVLEITQPQLAGGRPVGRGRLNSGLLRTNPASGRVESLNPKLLNYNTCGLNVLKHIKHIYYNNKFILCNFVSGRSNLHLGDESSSSKLALPVYIHLPVLPGLAYWISRAYILLHGKRKVFISVLEKNIYQCSGNEKYYKRYIRSMESLHRISDKCDVHAVVYGGMSSKFLAIIENFSSPSFVTQQTLHIEK